MSSSFVRLEVEKASSDFEGEMLTRKFDRFSVVELKSSAQVIHRLGELITPEDDGFAILSLQISGTGSLLQDGRHAVTQPGEMTLLNTSRPYTRVYDNDFRSLVLRLPSDWSWSGDALNQRQRPAPHALPTATPPAAAPGCRCRLRCRLRSSSQETMGYPDRRQRHHDVGGKSAPCAAPGIEKELVQVGHDFRMSPKEAERLADMGKAGCDQFEVGVLGHDFLQSRYGLSGSAARFQKRNPAEVLAG